MLRFEELLPKPNGPLDFNEAVEVDCPRPAVGPVEILPLMCSSEVGKAESNASALRRWNRAAVGAQRATAPKGSREYFEQIRAYRYGYETPFISGLFGFTEMRDLSVLEIGTGNGIDAVEMAKSGARYHGLDISANHLDLTRRHFAFHPELPSPTLVESDLMDHDIEQRFDVVYSFGVLHHIAHEAEYLSRVRKLLKPGGTLRIAVYSKYSFFNAYMFATWITRDRMRHSFNAWQSHVSDGTEIEFPVTIKIRSRREVAALLGAAGFQIERYHKRGFVQNYIPMLGRYFQPDGWTLNALGALLGWYHIFVCRPKP